MPKLVVALVTAAACGDNASVPDALVTPDVSIDAESMMVETGQIVEAAASDTGVANAKVCLVTRPEVPCVTTDANGNYTITVPGIPGDVQLAVDATAAGHFGTTVVEQEVPTLTTWPVQFALQTTAAATTLITSGGFTVTPGKGFARMVIFGTGTQRIAGATVAISPASGSVAYADASGKLKPALTATTSSGVVMLGDLTPGPITITVTAAGKTCNADNSANTWPGTGGSSAAALAVADTITENLLISCQ